MKYSDKCKTKGPKKKKAKQISLLPNGEIEEDLEMYEDSNDGSW